MEKVNKSGILMLFLAAVIHFSAFGQTASIRISGSITDPSGEALPGVSIFVENTAIGVSSDLDGNYSIDVPQGGRLSFSSIGFMTQTVLAPKSGILNIVLEEDTQMLEETVVVGYGVQKKESSVAAIAQVRGEDLARTNMTSIPNALSGQIAGVSVIQQSGMPGIDNTKVLIRGVSSWTGTAPLVLVDGVERAYSNIDPTEIETMSVLKDASATAVFGVRGANGVILITTKRGKAGSVKVSLTTEGNFKQAINMLAPENSYGTALVINEARKNDNDFGLMLSDEIIRHYQTQDMPYVYPSTNWQDFMLKNAWGERYNLNVSGGTEHARVFASISYLHDGDVINTIKNENFNPSWKYDRYNYRFNADVDVTRTTLLSIDAGGYIGFRNMPFETNSQRLFRPIFMLGPMDGVPVYPASVLDEYPDTLRPDETGERIGTTDLTNSENPLVANSYSGSRSAKTSNVNLSVRLKQDLDFITKGLNAKFQASYNNTSRWTQEISYNATTYKLLPDGTWIRRRGRDESAREDPEEIPSIGLESLNDAPYPMKNVYLEASINYDRTFGKHALTSMLVGQRRRTEQNVAFPSYEQGIAARLTYAFDNRYLFEGNLGYNGSEQFSPDKQYGFFPSFAVGYNLHNERFFAPLKNAIPRTKVRASWGQVGSDAASERWLFTSSYVTGSPWQYDSGLPGNTMQNPLTIVEEKAANLDAGWEVATKQDIGFEIVFFKQSNIVVNMDFYNEYRSGILLTRNSVPTYAGIMPKPMNLGKTRSKGYEIEIKFQYYTPEGNWYFFMKPSISFSDNRIVSRDEPLYTPAYQKQEGHRIDQIFAYHHTGWIQDADVASTATRYSGGLMGLGDTEYVDFNGDGNIDRNDMYAFGFTQTYPLYNYALAMGLTFKNLSMDLLFQGVSNISRQVVDAFAWPLHRLSNQVFAYQTDVWSPDNPDARYPSYHFDLNRVHNNTGDGTFRSVSIYDASYIRLKNVNLSFQFPEKLVKQAGISSLSVYLRGNNIFTWCPDFPLGDPEATDGGTNWTNAYYPMTRTFSLGLQLGF